MFYTLWPCDLDLFNLLTLGSQHSWSTIHPCAKFGDCSFSLFGSIQRTNKTDMQGGAKNGQKTNCMEIGELLQYYMLNTVINFLFKNFIALWRHLAKTPLLSFIHTVQNIWASHSSCYTVAFEWKSGLPLKMIHHRAYLVMMPDWRPLRSSTIQLCAAGASGDRRRWRHVEVARQVLDAADWSSWAWRHTVLHKDSPLSRVYTRYM